MSTIDFSKIVELITIGFINLIVDNIAVLITGILTYMVTKFEMRNHVRHWERELKLKERELDIQECEIRLKEREVNWTIYLQKSKIEQEQLLREKELEIRMRELELHKHSFKIDNEFIAK